MMHTSRKLSHQTPDLGLNRTICNHNPETEHPQNPKPFPPLSTQPMILACGPELLKKQFGNTVRQPRDVHISYTYTYIHIYIYTYIHIHTYIYMVTPPHDRPRPSKHRSHRRVRAFSGVSSLSPPNVSTRRPKPKKQKTKAPRRMLEQFWFFGFLVFGFLFFWFFGSLVFCFCCFFVCLVFWFYCGEGYISKKTPKTKKTKNQKTKEPKNQKNKKPKNQKTKKPKKQKTKEPKNQKTKKPKKQKTKTVPAFSVELWFFGFGRRVVLHGHVRRAQTPYPGKSRLILILILS